MEEYCPAWSLTLFNVVLVLWFYSQEYDGSILRKYVMEESKKIMLQMGKDLTFLWLDSAR